MYAVIETGGKQVKVAKGDSIFVEKLDVKEGDRLVLFSIKTKLGKADIHKEIEEIVYEEEK